MKYTILILPIIILLTGLGIAYAQTENEVKDTTVAEDLLSKTIMIKKWIDPENNVLCYVYYGTNEALSCLIQNIPLTQ